MVLHSGMGPHRTARTCFQSSALLKNLFKIQFGLELLKLLLNLVFTFGDLELIGIIEFDCRLQPEEMLGSVISFQGLNDLFGGCLDLRMFHLGKLERSLVLQPGP